MGFTVDIGLNWYDYYGDFKDNWLNLGLPVGSFQTEKLFNYYYNGDATIAIILYFPNFWELTLDFFNWSKTKESIFTFFKWDTDWTTCFFRYLIRKNKLHQHLQNNTAILYNFNGVIYHINCKYGLFDFLNNKAIINETIKCWGRMLNNFKYSIFIRVPLKQELLPKSFENNILRSTIESYDIGWNVIRTNIKTNSIIQFEEINDFNLGDYYPWDIHWNEDGNRKFAKYISQFLIQF